jgi:hypothetical protein
METFVGDILKIKLNAKITLTGYTVIIKYTKPDGTKGQWVAAINGGNALIMEYTTTTADLDQKGTWKLQGYAYTGTTVKAHGKVVDLEVFETLTPTTAP